jgi:protein-disulfide isomerase-like protein with CxxC motif
LIGCAADIGLNVTEFENDLKDMEIERQLQSEISMARNFNVMSYPSLRLKHNGKVASITLDYLNHETMYHEILKMNIN